MRSAVARWLTPDPLGGEVWWDEGKAYPARLSAPSVQGGDPDVSA